MPSHAIRKNRWHRCGVAETISSKVDLMVVCPRSRSRGSASSSLASTASLPHFVPAGPKRAPVLTSTATATAGHPSLRKLLPQVGFSWAVFRRRNKLSCRMEQRLALGLAERRAIVRGLEQSARRTGEVLGKRHTEKVLVGLFDLATAVMGDVRLNSFYDPVMFWEYLLSKHCRSSRPCDCQLQRTQWLHHPAITGKTLYNLVVLTIEARMFDQEYRQAPAWFMATRQKRPLVKAVNSFISKMESMYGGYSEVMDAYFGCIIKGAVHLDIPPEDELDGLWEMLAQLRIGGEELDNLLTLMAKLHIDDDEDMLDVEFLDLDEYYWWKEEGIY